VKNVAKNFNALAAGAKWKWMGKMGNWDAGKNGKMTNDYGA